MNYYKIVRKLAGVLLTASFIFWGVVGILTVILFDLAPTSPEFFRLLILTPASFLIAWYFWRQFKVLK